MTFDFANSLIPDTALSVAGLTDYIRLLLEQDEQLRQVWVTGEVSSANHHRSGLFFTLQDPDGTAGIKCVAWNSQVAKLAQLPIPGEQLIILGSLRVYPQRGEYQLSVWQALPAGVGLQALRYQQLKNRLLSEGFRTYALTRLPRSAVSENKEIFRRSLINRDTHKTDNTYVVLMM